MFVTCFCVLGSGVLTLLLAGYFAQQYLPPPKPKVVGIDLGEILNDCLFLLFLKFTVMIASIMSLPKNCIF